MWNSPEYGEFSSPQVEAAVGADTNRIAMRGVFVQSDSYGEYHSGDELL